MQPRPSFTPQGPLAVTQQGTPTAEVGQNEGLQVPLPPEPPLLGVPCCVGANGPCGVNEGVGCTLVRADF